ncbi:extracellular solute-binding protein [Meiothermus taiwanensis]|jgi:multiple sugar transport system substrate-binding protein|uniref:Cyclodextrin-binding protein n=2 Tax=Meiothermus taiwanensis TaxID=172827 RepID=A0A399DZ51_9DEIN|nr:extracellular solute-binding protein [Meiothermus taiwanensis]AWR85293.1 extracellular solute-binding protein family 1 [Meiothermus taiwanensis WR-220]KIQ55768.1 sugar ABC transporter substrate-binding protein [Meiothermus taiwanensis]KZK17058.1 sugar ABC transporter substrate-binding protein [Meiothermus taiwanensis]RIH77517.1 Cyclodextrin-binding protein [Meiothermus taiwanensis]
MQKALVILIALLGAALAQGQVTITYWQYDFKSKVEAVNELIKKFEAANPGIRVLHQTFPYDAYQQKVASSIPAGQGPDVVNLFYGWLPTWVKAGYLQPLPAEYVRMVDNEFLGMAQAAKVEGRLYGIPTAVRSLALFYNRDLLNAAGFNTPPKTWDEFLNIASKLTVRQGNRFTQLGYAMAPDGQDHHLVREVLIRQFGGRPYSDDGRRVLYGDAAGLKAFTFYTDWFKKHNVGTLGNQFFPGNNAYRDAFIAGRVGMIIDGSFAIGTIRSGAKFNWGVAELPVEKVGGRKVNYGSFWMHGLTPLATGPKQAASLKFLEFLVSEETQRYWLEKVGELPARKSLIKDPKLTLDKVFGPFVLSLAYAKATPFVDEIGQRKVMTDAINRVLLENKDPAESWRMAVAEEQKLLDAFWK